MPVEARTAPVPLRAPSERHGNHSRRLAELFGSTVVVDHRPSVSVVEPRTVDTGSPPPGRPFPTSVAGIPFGASPEAIERICEDAGSVIGSRGRSMACEPPPVQVFPELAVVAVAFCGDEPHACQIGLYFSGDSETLALHVVEQLERKYGITGLWTLDPGRRCDDDSADQLQFHASLNWRAPAGAIEIEYNCGSVLPGERGLAIWYLDADGVALAADLGERVDRNF